VSFKKAWRANPWWWNWGMVFIAFLSMIPFIVSVGLWTLFLLFLGARGVK
jgi:hypothetical protein